jgi:hypothetical protein
MNDIRRVTGTKYPNMVCKTCAHGKVWHRGEGPCYFTQCDCEVWDYGVNIEYIEDDEGEDV